MSMFILKILTKSEEIAITDPQGFYITIVSTSVVFTALLILYLAYTTISLIVKRTEKEKKGKRLTNEEVAAINIAIKMYKEENIHDKESYKITIRHK